MNELRTYVRMSTRTTSNYMYKHVCTYVCMIHHLHCMCRCGYVYKKYIKLHVHIHMYVCMYVSCAGVYDHPILHVQVGELRLQEAQQRLAVSERRAVEQSRLVEELTAKVKTTKKPYIQSCMYVRRLGCILHIAYCST